MKGKRIISVLMLTFLMTATLISCDSAEKEATTEKTTAEATTATEEQPEEVVETISSGEFEEENHYSIELPKAKWEKTGSMEEGKTVFTSNKGDTITISYYEGKDSVAKRKELPASEKGVKKKVFAYDSDKLLDFDRIAVGGKSDAIIRMYYAIKSSKGDSKYTTTYVISGKDATYIAEGTSTSKSKKAYTRLKECVKSMDLVYSFD